MRVPLAWLRDFVRLDVDIDELVHKLDMSGTKVEAVHRPGSTIEGVIVAEVVDIGPHPNADNLSMVEVDRGGERQTVVCGARNFSVGDRVPLAQVGARLPDGAITERKIRGEVSRGMLCSGSELGVSRDHSGILVLPPDAAVGTDVVQLLHLDDAVLELEITPNRPDCMSIIGVAREVAAVTGVALQEPAVPEIAGPDVSRAPITVEIRDASGCPRYLVRFIADLEVRAAPAWMTARLLAAGFRPISNIVDATNYVLLETGQPLHAFDAALVQEQRVIVRRAEAGEKMRTLDDVERALDPADLLIADPSGPLALAGVMGGLSSEVSSSTTDVVLESANFDPVSIAFTSRRHGLRSEASARFERGVDPEFVPLAAARATGLIVELAGGRAVGDAVDRYPAPPPPVHLSLRPARTERLLGLAIPIARQVAHLTSIGLDATEDAGVISVEIPTRRPDLAREADLIEEVARLEGFDKLPATISAGPAGGLDEVQRADRSLRRVLVMQGLTEAWTSSFLGARDLDRLELDDDHPARRTVLLANPMNEEEPALRTTLLPGLLRSAARNVAHRAPGVALFEVARIYRPSDGDLAEEDLALGAVFAGLRRRQTWRGPAQPWDFFGVKGVLETLCRALGADDVSVDAIKGMPFHPGRAAQIALGGRPLGVLGELHPSVCETFDVPERSLALELELAPLLESEQGRRRAMPLPRFPSVYMDIAVVLDASIPAAKVVELARAAGQPEVKTARLFDVYSGDQVPAGKKSLALALELLDPERTLTDEDAVRVRERVTGALSERFGATLRA